MPTSYTTQLGLSLPVQGELTGTWGDVTNTSMTSLVDTAIAGTTTLSTDADVTLTATVGVANQARAAVLLCSGARTVLRYITAPATSKVYTVINATTGGYAVVVRGVGPTTGVSVAAGTQLTVVWNGSDFVATGAATASLSGTVAIANGGTGSTSAVAALTALGAAPIASPTFTGTPAAPTAAAATNTTQLATTAHVFAERTNAATLTNKTLTAPVINSPTGLVKADVGLSSADNTSDANKPVSTAQQTALDLKANLASPTFTGVPAAPTAAPGTSTTQLATTAFAAALAFSTELPAQAGNAGKTITTDATNASWVDFPTAFKNKIINGNFDIWQRGTSASGTATRLFAADRWDAYQATSAATVTQGTFTVGQTQVPGEPTYFASIALNSLGTGSQFGQRIEDVRTLAGQTVAVSFWYKANAAVTADVVFRQNFGGGGSATVVTTVGVVSFTNTSTWAQWTGTITLPSISGKTIGTSPYLLIQLETFSATGFTFDIAQFQVESGSVATVFDQRPIGVELAMCQRYYFRHTPGSGGQFSGTCWAYSTANAYLQHIFPVPMRTTPSAMELSGTAADYRVALINTATACTGTPSYAAGTAYSALVIFTTAATLTSGQVGAAASNSAAGYLGWSAEL